MKTCPRCGKTYPDHEVFCEADGTALVPAEHANPRATTAIETVEPAAGGAPTECPVCGGKAEPGEVICNFCGTRLVPETAAAGGGTPAGGGAAGSSIGAASTGGASAGAAPTGMRPENFVPGAERVSTQEFEPPASEFDEGQAGGRRLFGIVGYAIAAVVALTAGIWLALYLSRPRPHPPVAQASPTATPAPYAPAVALARNLQIQIKGTDVAAALQRSPDSARQVFANGTGPLLDAYKQALTGDKTLHDGMIARLHVMPDGTVGSGAVMVSTAPNPSLDAEVISAMSGWKYAAVSGAPVDLDYPVIFATNPADASQAENALNTAYAALTPNASPEYASIPAPSAPAGGAVAPAPSVVAAPTPVRHRPPRAIARLPRPRPPSLSDQVNAAFQANRKLRRASVQSGVSGTVILSGRVFDDNDKQLAENTARGVSGVTNVVDNLTTDTSIWALNQGRITQQLQGAGLSSVTVKVIGNDAYLDGEVKTDLDKQRAVTITQAAAPGVKVRGNLIRVTPGNIFGF